MASMLKPSRIVAVALVLAAAGWIYSGQLTPKAEEPATATPAAAQAEADKAFIKSAVDGMVNSVPVETGQAVQPGAQIAEVVGPDPMLAVGAVSERQRGHLVIGQNASMRFIDGAVRNGTISFVSLSADKATRTYTVEARMPNPD